MKKTMAIMLALLLIVGMMTTGAAAVEEGVPTISVSSVQAAPGETADVTISLANNPGLVIMRLTVEYDEALTLTGVTDSGLLPGQNHSDDYTANPYTLYWENAIVKTNYDVNGVLATLHFTVSSTAEVGAHPVRVTYSVEDYDIMNVDMDSLEFAVESGGVTVGAAEPEFESHSLILQGKVGANFFMKLPTGMEPGTMDFTVSGKGGFTKTGVAGAEQADGTYVYTCPVNALQMADTITATYHYGDGRTVSQTYSVQDYIQAVCEKMPGTAMETLAKKLANYGHYAQKYLAGLRGFTVGTDYATIAGYAPEPAPLADLSTYPVVVSGEDSNINGTQVSLLLDSGTQIRLYVHLKENTPQSVMVNGTPVTAAEEGNQWYSITTEEISAKDLNKQYAIAVDGLTVKMSVLSYVNLMKNDAAASKTMGAIYEYYTAAQDFANSN